MKNKKVITLIMAAAASCSSVYAATLPTSEVDAYILAMNTMSPITAKYTIQYKQAVEQKCNTALSVEQLNSKAFTNVVQAMCCGQLKLATALEFFQYRFSDSFGGNPPLYSCGLSAL